MDTEQPVWRTTLPIVVEAMDKVFGRKLELLCKDGSKETIPTAATVVGLFFASSNVETQDCAARVAQHQRRFVLPFDDLRLVATDAGAKTAS